MDFRSVEETASSSEKNETRGEANSMETEKENEGHANLGPTSSEISTARATELISTLGRLADQFQHVTVDIQKLSSSIKQMEEKNRKGKNVITEVDDATAEQQRRQSPGDNEDDDQFGQDYNISSKCGIFRIPEVLIQHTPKAYFAKVFLLGPWFPPQSMRVRRDGNDIQLGNKIKRDYADKDGKISGLKEAVFTDEAVKMARAYYEGPISMSKDKFVDLLVDSGCFILEFLYRTSKVGPKVDLDPIFSKAYMLKCLCHDLILLENQIPWFVLERIYKLTKPFDPPSLKQRVIRFFTGTFFDEVDLGKVDLIREPFHIVDLLRELLLFSLMEDEKRDAAATKSSKSMADLMNPEDVAESSKGDGGLGRTSKLVKKLAFSRRFHKAGVVFWKNRSNSLHKHVKLPSSELEMKLPSASRLDEAGIKFVKGKSNVALLNVKFHKGVFTIPRLLVHDNTETFFRNLICFEQCSPDCEPIISSYAKIMDNLIDTVDDLEILCKSGVIHNTLDPEEAVQVFNRLYTDTSNKGLYYRELYSDVNIYCLQWGPRWRAFYIQNYFSKPWAIVSQLFALVILILTILQVVSGFK